MVDTKDLYHFQDDQHVHNMWENLREIQQNQQFCDVTIKIDSFEYPANRIILSAFSPYFKTMFLSGYLESTERVVNMKGIDPDIMKLVLDYAYSGHIEISESTCPKLLYVADLLQVMSIREAVVTYLKKRMDVTNCVGIYILADLFSCDVLKSIAMFFITKHFLVSSSHEEFKDLTVKQLADLLDSNDLDIDEEVIFEAAIIWHDANPKQRTPIFHEVLRSIRLALMEPSFLLNHVEPLEPVQANLECLKLILEAKLYHKLPEVRSGFKKMRKNTPRGTPSFDVMVTVGGIDRNTYLHQVECYNFENQSWHQRALLPTFVCNHGLVSCGNKLYLVGGKDTDGVVSNKVWRYEPILDVWSEVAHMLSPRMNCGLAAIGEYIYAVGGLNRGSCLESVERYNINTDSWSYVHRINNELVTPKVVPYKGDLYAAGMTVFGNVCVEAYRPLKNSWASLSYVPQLNIVKNGSAVCCLRDHIYIIGGLKDRTYTSGTFFNPNKFFEGTDEVSRFNIKTCQWEEVLPMQTRRWWPGVAVVDDRIYVFGGQEYKGFYTDTVECFDPNVQNHGWSIVDIISPRSCFSCSMLKLYYNSENSFEEFCYNSENSSEVSE